MQTYERPNGVTLTRPELKARDAVQAEPVSVAVVGSSGMIEGTPGDIYVRVGSLARAFAYRSQTAQGSERHSLVVAAPKSQGFAATPVDVTETAKDLGITPNKTTKGEALILQVRAGNPWITIAPGTIEESNACKTAALAQRGKSTGDVIEQ